MQYMVTGDTHGLDILKRLEKLHDPKNEALIVLGDAGLNFWLNKTDDKLKRNIQNTGFLVYCVRGNHEERPENIEDTKVRRDESIDGFILYQDAYPNIRYLIDGFNYCFNGHSTLVIGGAYSVDKWYRLSQKRSDGWSGWFLKEQLSPKEMENITKVYAGESFDFILTHTCPYSWRPTELFLSSIDSSQVDTTMEEWMDKFKDTINYKTWLFGHFHADMKINDKAYMLYRDVVNMEEFLK